MIAISLLKFFWGVVVNLKTFYTYMLCNRKIEFFSKQSFDFFFYQLKQIGNKSSFENKKFNSVQLII